MRVIVGAVVLAIGAHASGPNKALGTKLGDLLASNVGDESFTKTFETDVLSTIPVVQNPAVQEAIKAANAKASFLQGPSGVNLHLADSPNYEATAAAELASAQRRKLISILKDEVAAKEASGNAMAGQGAQWAAGASFLQGPLEDAQYHASGFSHAMSSIGDYTAAVKAGGYTAARALASLTNLLAEPNSKVTGQLMSPLLLTALRNLMLKESTPDQIRTAAGSIITTLTGMPVSGTTVDTGSGGYGHVNIVLPRPSRVYESDYAVSASKAGSSGNYYPSGSFLKKQKAFPFQMPEELIGDVNKGAASVNIIAEAGEDVEGQEMLKSIKRAA